MFYTYCTTGIQGYNSIRILLKSLIIMKHYTVINIHQHCLLREAKRLVLVTEERLSLVEALGSLRDSSARGADCVAGVFILEKNMVAKTLSVPRHTAGPLHGFLHSSSGEGP